VSRKRQQHWERLQREYRRAVAVEYPNPERKGCPGAEALRHIVSVRPEDLQRSPEWKHALQCGPCYEEYIAFRDITARRTVETTKKRGWVDNPAPSI
jgi:hypothetical protein